MDILPYMYCINFVLNILYDHNRYYSLAVPSSLTSCTILRTLWVNFPTKLVPAETKEKQLLVKSITQTCRLTTMQMKNNKYK